MINTLNENKIGVWLQIDTYDNNNNCIVKHFEVPKWWLQSKIEEEYRTIENYLNTYTSNESNIIYQQATLENMILCEMESK